MEKYKFRKFDEGLNKFVFFDLKLASYFQGEGQTTLFSGLYDKNGIGIYEGDLVALESSSYPNKYCPLTTKEVIFDQGRFVLKDMEIGEFYPIPSDLSKKWVVIGNIFEKHLTSS